MTSSASSFTLHKLRRNQPLTQADLTELERMLAESGTGTVQEVERAIRESHGLGLLIRSLVGLDRHAASTTIADES